MPWAELLALIEPHALLAETGRPPRVIARMLRIHCMQQWFVLSDLGAEEALFENNLYASTEHYHSMLDKLNKHDSSIQLTRCYH